MPSHCAAVFDTAIMLQEKKGNSQKFSISIHSHSVPVAFIDVFLVADEFFPDCRRPGVFVNMIASNCCPYGEFKTRHFVLRNAPNKALQGFAVRSNVSSR